MPVFYYLEAQHDTTAQPSYRLLLVRHCCYHCGFLVSLIGGDQMIHYSKQHETLNAVFVDDSNADILLRQLVPETKRQKRILIRKGIRHFQPIEHIGQNLKVQCWCGDSIEVNYFDDDGIDGMSARLQRWCDEHESCPAPEPKGNT
jgi:hypothetical protein